MAASIEKVRGLGIKHDVSSNFDPLLTTESTPSGPGWPLLRVKTSASSESQQESQADGISAIRWVLSLPNRSKKSNYKYSN